MSFYPSKRIGRRPTRPHEKGYPDSQVAKKEKFDFEKMKVAATSDDPMVRKAEFVEYFERFNVFPSFLFDNQYSIDPRLAATMRDLSEDTNSSEALLEGVRALLGRLPS